MRKIPCPSLFQDCHINSTSQLACEYILNIGTAGLNHWKILRQVQHTHEVRAHAVEHGETCCMIPQKLKTMMQHWESGHMICQTGWRNSLKIKWTTKLQHQAMHPLALLVNHLIRNLQEKWYRVRKVFSHTSRRTETAKYAKAPKTRAICRKRTGNPVLRAEKIGDLITEDHKVLRDECESRNNHRYAVVVQDLATQSLQSYPCKTKNSQETERSSRKFLEPTDTPNVIFTHNSLEFGKSCKDLSCNLRTSAPHRSETNGNAERAIRRIKEVTSAGLLQSGLDENWWADSLECYTYLRNIQDLLSDGKTPYERRFGKSFKGPIIPFGSLVEYYPISAKEQSRIHQFGKKVLLGLFLGYALYAEGIWKGDILVADVEELEKMDASEIYSKRLNAKEGKFLKENGKFVFPVADGRIKLSG